MILNEFLYPHRSHTDQADSMARAFDEKLEDFAQQVSYTCNLEVGGKLSPADAYERLGNLWQQLQVYKEELGI
jgi:hypothetical protein